MVCVVQNTTLDRHKTETVKLDTDFYWLHMLKNSFVIDLIKAILLSMMCI